MHARRLARLRGLKHWQFWARRQRRARATLSSAASFWQQGAMRAALLSLRRWRRCCAQQSRLIQSAGTYWRVSNLHFAVQQLRQVRSKRRLRDGAVLSAFGVDMQIRSLSRWLAATAEPRLARPAPPALVRQRELPPPAQTSRCDSPLAPNHQRANTGTPRGVHRVARMPCWVRCCDPHRRLFCVPTFWFARAAHQLKSAMAEAASVHSVALLRKHFQRMCTAAFAGRRRLAAADERFSARMGALRAAAFRRWRQWAAVWIRQLAALGGCLDSRAIRTARAAIATWRLAVADARLDEYRQESARLVKAPLGAERGPRAAHPPQLLCVCVSPGTTRRCTCTAGESWRAAGMRG